MGVVGQCASAVGQLRVGPGGLCTPKFVHKPNRPGHLNWTPAGESDLERRGNMAEAREDGRALYQNIHVLIKARVAKYLRSFGPASHSSETRNTSVGHNPERNGPDRTEDGARPHDWNDM